MTRYQALRRMGCGVVTAATIAFLNKVWGVPDGLILFMNVEIEYPK